MKIKFKIEDIKVVAEKILTKILKMKRNKAIMLSFYGDLGSGKTTITKSIGELLSIKEKIISPTFVIMKIYNVGESSKYYKFFKKLIHIDAYRFSDKEEISVLNLDQFLEDKNNLIIIEWPALIEKGLQKVDFFPIKLEHINEETRMIEF